MLRNTCRLNVTKVNEMQLQLQCTWCCLQSISQEHMTRLRVSAVFHRSVEDYCQQLLQLRLDLRVLYTKQQQQQQQQLQLLQYKQQHSYCNKNNTDKTAATFTAESSETFELERDHLRQHLLKREQLLLEVGRMVRLGRLLKTRLKEPFILDANSGQR